MKINEQNRKRFPVWLRFLTVILAVWVAIAVAVNVFATGGTTVNANVGDVNVSALLPSTYKQKVNGETLVFDENGKPVYEEVRITEEEAESCVNWNYDGDARSLSGSLKALISTDACGSQTIQSLKADLVFQNNNTNDDMIVSFNYEYTTSEGGGHFEGLVNGANAFESGSVAVKISAGESKSITLFSGETNEGITGDAYGTITINLTNINVVNAEETYHAVLTPANNGIYKVEFTDSDDDAQSYVVTTQAITPELRAQYPDSVVINTEENVEYKLASGITLTALSANTNFRFDHWMVGSQNKGSETPLNIIPADNSVVTAAFVQEGIINAFKVGNQVYPSWNAAVAEALSTGNPIILNEDYSLPANAEEAEAAGETEGDYVTVNGAGLIYTIPANVRFVVPKSESDFGNFTNVLPSGVKDTTPITHFRTLTVPSGVTLQINGEISVNGDYYCKQPYETVVGGAHGLVSLNQDAKINVSNGGKIWCYGFIAGAGEVVIAEGGHASEFLQITDWGGGSAALGWATNNANLHNAFYFSQYYVQNIEARLTVYKGATTEVAVAIVAQGQIATSSAAFIGEGGLFHVTEDGGYITRIYDSATDRTNYEIHGDTETSGITVSIMQYQLSSDAYVLGINGNISLDIVEGETTLLNDFMLLPGTEIKVGENASVEIVQSAPMNQVNQETNEIETVQRPVRLFIIDDYEWNNTIDPTADPLTQLQQLNNGQANYSYPKKQNTLPYTVANGTDNDEIRGNVTATSATIEVNGTLEASSNIFTTNYIGYLYDTMAEMLNDPEQRAALEAQYGAQTVEWAETTVNQYYNESKDKLITGSGTIINNPPTEGLDGNLNLLTQTGTTKNQVNIPTAECLVDLNGDGTYSELGTGIYESAGVDPVTGTTVWYKNQITYHLVVVDPATQHPVGVLPDITRKVGYDYDILTVEDLTIAGQRYAIFGFDASTIQSYNTTTGKMDMQGIPIGFIPADGEIVKDGTYNLESDSRNRNFATPASWQTLMANPSDLMTYLMLTGVTSGWDELGFVFADLTVMANQTWTMADMLTGGLNGEITVYVAAYDHYVAWENETTGERAQNYLPSGLTAAQYVMNAEAVITPTVTDPATGDAIAITPAQSIDEDAHTTTVTVTGVDSDMLVSMTAQYTKVNIVWQFVDVNDQTIVYDEITETAHPVADPAVSPAISNPAHAYYLLAENANVKLSNEENSRFVTGDLPVTLTGIDEPVTITILVDPFDYKISFTTDKDGTSIEDKYVKDGDDLTLKIADIITEAHYCFANAAVTGTATAEITHEGAELAITGIGSDCTAAVTLTPYDYLVRYSMSGSIVKYDFVTSGATSSYEYPANTYDSSFTFTLNNGSQPSGLVYTPATEGQPAVITVNNVNADRTVSLNVNVFDRALIIYDENNVIQKLYYGNGSDAGDNYRYQANQYVKNLVNPNGAIVEDHLDYLYAYIRTNGTGYFPVTVQIGTYYHVVEFRYFMPDGTINGTQLTDVDNVALSTRIFVEEEDGTVGIDTDDFLAAYTAGNKAVQMYQAAGEKVFLYLANYSETGDGHTNTYVSADDNKSITVSNIGKNAFVNVIVVPYANTITVTDSGLNTTNLYYVDSNGNNLTNSYKAAGTAPVTYAAGANRAIFGIEGLTGADIDATPEEIANGVDSVTFSNITSDAAVTLTTISTKHKLTVEYIDPWGVTDEIIYPEGDVYTVSFTDREIKNAVVTTEDGSTATYTANGFTVTMPDANTVTKVVVEFRHVCAPGEERLVYNASDAANSNIKKRGNSNPATIEVTDSYYGIFTVECQYACMILIDNGDGTYTKLDAVPVDGETDKYQFTCPANFSTDISITVAVKGDTNGNGTVDSGDATKARAVFLGKTSYTTELDRLVGDANGNGSIDSGDATRIRAVYLGKTSFSWF